MEVRPHSYKYGSNGPTPQRQEFLQRVLGEEVDTTTPPTTNTTTKTTRLDGTMVSSL